MGVFLLDTNIVVRSIKDREPAINANIASAIERNHSLALSVISLHELQVGVLRNANHQTAAKKLSSFLQLISQFWDFDQEDAMMAAEVRVTLMRRGNAIGHYDTLIAAQALRRNATAVTNNVREFERIAGLQWVDWTRD